MKKLGVFEDLRRASLKTKMHFRQSYFRRLRLLKSFGTIVINLGCNLEYVFVYFIVFVVMVECVFNVFCVSLFPPVPRGSAVLFVFSALLNESVDEWIHLFRTCWVDSSLIRFLMYRRNVLFVNLIKRSNKTQLVAFFKGSLTVSVC